MKQTIRKLVLNADALRVETFAAQDSPTENAGTVRGHLGPPTEPQTCPCPQTYNNCPSWSGRECNTVCIG